MSDARPATPPCHCTVARRAARAITALYDRMLEPTGLTAPQLSLLRNLQRQGPLSITRLARVLHLDRTTLARNVRPLEQARWVTFRARTEDQRERVVELTASGGKGLERADALWGQAQREVESRVGAERLRVLREVLVELEALESRRP
jgi:DNA-binding MarR family transcriptional regulator